MSGNGAGVWEPGTRFEYHATAAQWVLADLIELRVCKPLGSRAEPGR